MLHWASLILFTPSGSKGPIGVQVNWIHLGSFPKNLRCSTGRNTQKFSSQNVMSFCLAGEICVDPLPEILTHQLPCTSGSPVDSATTQSLFRCSSAPTPISSIRGENDLDTCQQKLRLSWLRLKNYIILPLIAKEQSTSPYLTRPRS